MTTPIVPAEIAAQVPHHSDVDIVELVQTLVGAAMRRQAWLMFFDEQARPNKLIVPYADLGDDPPDAEIAAYARMACELASLTSTTSVVFTWERPGPPHVGDGERRLLAAISAAIEAGGVQVRACLLSHDDGVDLIAEESS